MSEKSKKFALIIANTEYNDPGLAKLSAPGKDAKEFWRVLDSPNFGAFDEVMLLFNEDSSKANEKIEIFFSNKTRDDLLVLYFSGHGVKDEYGLLYLAVKNTNRDRLYSTAINSTFISQMMDRSRSKRIVLILDCCNSGAFAQGTKAASGGSMGTASAFEAGYGRVILTASDSTQFAWEGDKVIGETENSLFTHYLVKGLEGAADHDMDGRITVDELYNYAYEKVKLATPKQTPSKFSRKEQGEILLRENMRLEDIKPAPLEPALLDAIESPYAKVQLGAVEELIQLMNGRHPGKARAARESLEKIIEDENRPLSVSKLAKQALESVQLVGNVEEQKYDLALKISEEDEAKLAAAQAERLAAKKAEEDSLAQAKLEAEQLAKAKAKADLKANDEAKRLAAQKEEKERVAKVEREAARLVEEKQSAEEKARPEKQQSENIYPQPKANIQQPIVSSIISEKDKPSKLSLRSLAIAGGIIAALCVCGWLSNGLLGADVPTLSPAEETETAMAQATEDHISQVTGTSESQAAQTQIAIPTVTVQAREQYIKSLDAKAIIIFGPENGELEHNPDASMVILQSTSTESIRDFIATATFRNPYEASKGPWNYGFAFRGGGESQFRIYIGSGISSPADKRWGLDILKSGNVTTSDEGNLGDLNLSAGGTNTITIYCVGNKGWLYVNNEYIKELNLSDNVSSGSVAVGTGFIEGSQVNGTTTAYENLIVKEIP